MSEPLAYTYCADIFCPDCIVAVTLSGRPEIDPNDGTVFPQFGTVERDLDVIAGILGINRTDEHTFDSSEFPKVTFSQDDIAGQDCGACREPLEGERHYRCESCGEKFSESEYGDYIGEDIDGQYVSSDDDAVGDCLGRDIPHRVVRDTLD